MSSMTMTMTNTLTNTLTTVLRDQMQATWAEFKHVSDQAAREAKHRDDGSASAETQMQLDTLADRMDLVEAELARRDAVSARSAGAGSLSLLPTTSSGTKSGTGTLTLNGATYTYPKNTPAHARFVKTLRVGMRGLADYQRERVTLAEVTPEMKAMTLSDETTGGFMASPEFATDLLVALQEASPARQVSTVHVRGAGSGELLPVLSGIPAASRVSEIATRSSVDASFSERFIPVDEASVFFKVSRHLLEDASYPLDTVLVNAARMAFAKLEGTELIKGTGVGQFAGLNNLTFDAGNSVTGSDTTGHKVSAVDIQKLLHETLAGEYLPDAKLLLNKKTLSAIRQLTATSGAVPLFPVVDSPQTLAGVPFVLCPDMDDAGSAGKNAVFLLHPAAYTVVQRQDVVVLRLLEQFAETGHIGFMVFIRSGGQPVLKSAVAKIVTG